MRIRDLQVSQFIQRLPAAPQKKIDDANVLTLLAAVGDGWLKDETTVLGLLTAPGVTRAQQLEIARAGMNSDELADVKTILDESGFAMSAGAKNFLEALVGRAPLETQLAPLQLEPDQGDGLRGTAKAGVTVEAINLSTAPAGRLHLTDTVAIGTADAFGRFSGSLPDLQEGDFVRLRTRDSEGKTSDWVTIRAQGIASSDSRNAQVNLERIDIAATPDGQVEITQNTARPVSEPEAIARLKNLRTGALHDFRMTPNGGLPSDLKLPGLPGDQFELAVSDGRNNQDFAQVAGVLKVPGGGASSGVDLEDPAPLDTDLTTDGAARYAKARYTGPLFIDGPAPSDVKQGAIGNCFFPAALAAVAHVRPDAIEDMIKDNGDGTYTVRFYSGDWSGPGAPAYIDVDADLYSRSYGGPVYGASLGGSTAADKMELWFPLVEKAYAKWKGGYRDIGKGGVSGRVMQEVMGARYDYEVLAATSADNVYAILQRAEQKGWPATAGTFGKERADLYTNTGVYANHAYSILGTEEENGTKYVKLRNPWGQSEPGWDGRNDGIFRLELDKFTKLYSSIAVCEAPRGANV